MAVVAVAVVVVVVEVTVAEAEAKAAVVAVMAAEELDNVCRDTTLFLVHFCVSYTSPRNAHSVAS